MLHPECMRRLLQLLQIIDTMIDWKTSGLSWRRSRGNLDWTQKRWFARAPRFVRVSKQLLPSPATAWAFRTPKLTQNELKHLAGSRGWPAGFPFRPIRTADPYAFAQSGNGPPGSHFVEKPMENHRMRKLWKWAAGDAFR